MRELLNDLLHRLDALESDASRPEDWNGFLDQARLLHERALLLRYKSLERLHSLPEDPAPSPTIVWGSPQPEPAPTESNEVAVGGPAIEIGNELAPERAVPEAEAPPAEAVSLAEKLSLQPLPAILPSLGINDRVRFAGVLFGGDMGTLQAACAVAEGAADLASARNAVEALAVPELDWTNEVEAPFQFMLLVQRVHLK